MEISKGVEIVDLGIFIKTKKVLAISDLQLGYEELLNSQGAMMPRFNYKEIVKRLENKILTKIKADTIILNGDIKHEFGRITEQEWRETVKIIDLLKKNCKRLIMIKGNHDSILKPIAEEKNTEMLDHFIIEKNLFIHGHKEPEKKLIEKCERIIIGHEHPAITIREGAKSEQYKCFIKGKYEGKELIVMPSFNFVAMGSDITREKTLSPLIKNIQNFEVYVIEDQTYFMGKARNYF